MFWNFWDKIFKKKKKSSNHWQFCFIVQLSREKTNKYFPVISFFFIITSRFIEFSFFLSVPLSPIDRTRINEKIYTKKWTYFDLRLQFRCKYFLVDVGDSNVLLIGWRAQLWCENEVCIYTLFSLSLFSTFDCNNYFGGNFIDFIFKLMRLCVSKRCKKFSGFVYKYFV